MGTYDVYGKEQIQLKAGSCDMMYYEIGDKVEIEDGVYLGYEGIVVVKDKILIATFNENSLFTKWGNQLNVNDIINPNNPIVKGKLI